VFGFVYVASVGMSPGGPLKIYARLCDGFGNLGKQFKVARF
jgi:hypothetical protein